MAVDPLPPSAPATATVLDTAIDTLLGAALGTGLAVPLAARTMREVATTQGWFDAGMTGLITAELLHQWGPWALGLGLGLAATTAALSRWRQGLHGVARGLLLMAAGGLWSPMVGVASIQLQRPSGPNVLLISIDTLRADRVSSYGYDRPTTPAVDARLAAQGVLFEEPLAASPKTTPSHMTMLTGLDPCSHGVPLWDQDGGPELNPKVHTLAELLGNAGYRTAAFTDGAYVSASRGFGQGFDHYDEERNPDNDVNADAAITWLEDNSDAPFFLFLHSDAAHGPYLPPADYALQFARDVDPGPMGPIVDKLRGLDHKSSDLHERFWRNFDGQDPDQVAYVSDLYDAGIRRVDDQLIGPLLDTLDRLDLAEDTLIVFTSDHGDDFMEHGAVLHDHLYRHTLRVPLILRWPGHLPQGRRVPTRVGVIDVVPTVLELVGLDTPAYIQGSSLVQLAVTGGDALAVDRTVVSQNEDLRGLRHGSWSLLHESDGPALYDLGADPDESNNVRAAEADESARMTAQLQAWRAECEALHGIYGPATQAGAVSDEEVELRALGDVD